MILRDQLSVKVVLWVDAQLAWLEMQAAPAAAPASTCRDIDKPNLTLINKKRVVPLIWTSGTTVPVESQERQSKFALGSPNL